MRSKWIKDSVYDLKRVRDVPMERGGMYRMDRNERTWPIPDKIIEEIRNKINTETLTNYPEMDGIYRKLSGYLDVTPEQIYFHSGSDLVIKSIFETYLGKGDCILMQNPSYAMYGVYARLYEAEIHEQSYDTDLRFDIDEYCVNITKIKPKIVILENPSGYIGNSYSHEEVKRVIESARDAGSLILVDEAYIDYITEANAMDLISEYNNLIIVRTFSKAWGLAGMRAGYAVSNELIISEIFKVMPMHELTTTTIIAVDTVLNHTDEMKPYIDEVRKVREYFLKAIETMDIRAVQSNTHFVTVALGERMDAEDFRKKAHENRYFVRRPFGQKILKDWVRIGLLPLEEMRGFISFMGDYVSEKR